MFLSRLLLKVSLIVMAFIAFPSGHSLALEAGSDEPLYTVSGIKVDKTASSAAIARERAMLDAEQKAYGTVLGRISLPADSEGLNAPTIDELANMVDGVSISGEKTSSVRYIGTLTVSFKPKAVKRFLETNGVPYINAISAPVLIIPTINDNSGSSFDPNHASFVVWRNHKDDSLIVPVVLPESEGDLKDLVPDFLKDKTSVSALKEAYGVEKVYIAGVNENTSAGNMTFYLSEEGSETVQPFKFTVSTNVGKAKAYKAAFDTIISKLENDFKQGNVVEFSSASSITAVVPIDSIADWLKVQKKLSGIAIIDHYELQAMRSDKVQIIIYFGRGINRLISEMAAAKLILEEGSGGVWVLYEKGNKKIISDASDKPTPEVSVYNLDAI